MIASFADGSACPVDFSKGLMDAARRESCGKCVLCREGTWQVYEIIKDITEGKTESGDLELLTEILEQISDNGGCEMSAQAASVCLGLLRNYHDEWDMHIRRKRCTSLTCSASYTVYIAPELCDGCGKCVEACPEVAILGEKERSHVIQTEKCSKCMLCADICPRGAIKKIAVGALKPKATGEEGSSMRRRRRGE